LQIPLSCLSTEQSLYRPAEISENYGNPEKAKRILNWSYNWSLEQLIQQLLADEQEVREFLKQHS
jgi:GDP-D-mannose dehydratase